MTQLDIADEKLVLELLACRDDNAGLTETEMLRFYALITKREKLARVDELRKLETRYDTLVETSDVHFHADAYARNRIATLTDKKEESDGLGNI